MRFASPTQFQSKTDELLSTFAAITINLILIVFLLRTGNPTAPARTESIERTRLFFTSAHRHDTEAHDARDIRSMALRSNDGAESTFVGKSVVTTKSDGIAFEENKVPAADSDISTEPLNLGPPTEHITFSSNALGRPKTTDLLEARPVLRTQAFDSTLMGRLQRLQRRMDCADLRKALLKEPDSSGTILTTMRERGCER